MADMPYWYTGPKPVVYEGGKDSFIGGPARTVSEPEDGGIVNKVLDYFRAIQASKDEKAKETLGVQPQYLSFPKKDMPSWYTGPTAGAPVEKFNPSGTGMTPTAPAGPREPGAVERMVGGATRYGAANLMAPFAVAGDLASKGVHGALGLEEANPMSYTSGVADMMGGALKDVAGPPSRGANAFTQMLRDWLISSKGAKRQEVKPAAAQVAGAPSEVDTELFRLRGGMASTGGPSLAAAPTRGAFPQPARAMPQVGGNQAQSGPAMPPAIRPAPEDVPPPEPVGALAPQPSPQASLQDQYRQKIAALKTENTQLRAMLKALL